MDFAWDSRKARTNLAKHGVSFEEGRSVFFDEGTRLIHLISARCATTTEEKIYWSLQ